MHSHFRQSCHCPFYFQPFPFTNKHIFDFATVLAQLDEETRLRYDILNKSSAALELKKKDLNKERDKQEQQVQEQFQGRNDGVVMVQKTAMLNPDVNV